MAIYPPIRMFRLNSGPLKSKVTIFVHETIIFFRSVDYERHDFVVKNITTQAIRSATSIRANLAEAEMALSDKDFKRILGICLREANETKTRLEIFQDDIGTPLPAGMVSKIEEIMKILITILKKLRK